MRGKPRGDKRRKGQRPGRPGSERSDGPRTYSSAPPKKERKADPDSPFAALAGLLDNSKSDG
jgi:ATP-dependent RNA helicase SUPV3L1/SUV3